MPKTKKPRTYSDEEAKADEEKGPDVTVSQEDATVAALAHILAGMRSLPLARLYERMFGTMGKPRRRDLCRETGFPYNYNADAVICVKGLKGAMKDPEAREIVLRNPWCQGFLVEAFGNHPALRNLIPSG